MLFRSYRDVLVLCNEQFMRDDQEHRRLAFNVLVKSVSFLLHRGLFEDFAAVLTPDALTDYESRRLLNTVDEFLEMEEVSGRAATTNSATEYVQKIRDWIELHRPLDFDGRLRSVCAREPWDRRFSSDASKKRDETD